MQRANSATDLVHMMRVMRRDMTELLQGVTHERKLQLAKKYAVELKVRGDFDDMPLGEPIRDD